MSTKGVLKSYFLRLNKVFANHVAIVLPIFLKSGNEDGVVLKPTWEVKDNGGMGVRTCVLGEWPPMTHRQSWEGPVPGQMSRGQFWRPGRQKPGRTRGAGPRSKGW